MATLTVEGIVENGQIRLNDGVTLPEHAKVYVIIPGVETAPQMHVYSPLPASRRYERVNE